MNTKNFTLYSLVVGLMMLLGSNYNYTVAQTACQGTGIQLDMAFTVGAFAGEVGFELVDQSTGDIVAYATPGNFTGATNFTVFVDEGDYEIRAYDSFGDGWNGCELEVQQSGQTLCVAGLPSGGFSNFGSSCGAANNGGTVACSFTVAAPSCTIECPGDIQAGLNPGSCEATINLPPPVLGADCVGPATLQGTTGATPYVFSANLMQVSPATMPANLPQADGAVTIELLYDGDHGGATFEAIDLVDPDGNIAATCISSGADCSNASASYTVGAATFNGWLSSYPGGLSWAIQPAACNSFNGINPFTCNNEFEVTASYVAAGAAQYSIFIDGQQVNGLTQVFNAGDYEVCYVSSDPSGLLQECCFTVSVADTEAPTLDCPGDQTISLDAGECRTVYNFTVSAEDNCPPVAGNISGPYCDPCADPSAGSALACAPFSSNSIIQFIDLPGGGTVESVTYNQETFGNAPLATFNLYAVQAGGAVPYEGGGFTPLGSVQYQTSPADNGSCVTVDFAAPVDVPAGGVWLEVFTPGTTLNSRIVQTPADCNGNTGTGLETYINAPNCGLTPPQTFASLGFFLDAGFSLGYNSGDIVPTPTDNPGFNDFVSGDVLEAGGTYCFQYEAEDAQGNVASCEWCVTIEEFANPRRSLACNDEVNLSVDENCEAFVGADDILEGGPYGCYDNYGVDVATDMNFNNIVAQSLPGESGAVISGAQVGDTYFVRVIDPETGNSCWGLLNIEDKLIPELSCSATDVNCGADVSPGATYIGTLQELFDLSGTNIPDAGSIDVDLDGTGIPANAVVEGVRVDLDIAHTWVSDLSATLTSPSGTESLIFEFPGTCTGNDLEVSFFDAAPNTAADFQNTCNNAPAVEGDFQPVDLFEAFLGEPASGVWVFTIEDDAFFDTGSITAGAVIIDYSAELEIPFPFDNFTSAVPNGPNSFIVSGFDPCGDVEAVYVDNMETFGCDSEFASRIFRDWTVTDESGNVVTCQDTINVLRSDLGDIVLPPDYDEQDAGSLTCTGEGWDLGCNGRIDNRNGVVDVLEGNGYPDPCETGAPNSQICDNIFGTYVDQVIPVCEGTYKILRRWTFLDWCTGETAEHVQLIKVVDDEDPVIDCPADVTISTGVNDCVAAFSVPDISGNITDGCSPSTVSWTVSSSAGEVIDFGNNIYQIIDLPIGSHSVIYTANDGCGNEATCEQIVTVADQIAPVAVCDQETKVALGQDGTARVFWQTVEDGSYDNCGIASISVVRMSEPDCEPTRRAGQDFRDYVEFCCEDVGETHQVMFRVVDNSGNANTCMVNVTVEDKLPPVLVQPRDLTLSCTYDFDIWNLEEFGVIANINNGEVRQTREIYDEAYEVECLGVRPYDPTTPTYSFQDGYATDNCNVEITETYDDQRDQCGRGVLLRLFTATDEDGNSVFPPRVQRITFQDCDPFQESDIRWPRDLDNFTCSTSVTSLHPDSIGSRPTYNGNSNDECALIAQRYEDEVFEVTPDACFKILRHWQVLDWCQYDDETGAGLWEYTQTIKVVDDEAPILTNCEDVTFCDSAAVECTGFATLVQEVEDCTPAEFLKSSWRIDPFNQNNNPADDITGTGLDASGYYPFGTHKITWIVEDMCGNVETCQYLFTVEDCKLPTPYCLNGIATVVMPSNGEITITAESFDAGSFDNCGPITNFSFSSDVNETERVYTCDDLDNGGSTTFEIEIWVTDQAGNQDFCVTYVVIQDNMDACPDSNSIVINGTAATALGAGVENAEASLQNMNAPVPMTRTTDAAGQYSFNAAMNLDYQLSASKNDDPLNGVSTLDIALIQQHILGLNEVTDPYYLIAANVNDDERITGADIIDMRKVILGLEPNFPNNTSWRFVNATENLAEGVIPRGYAEVVELNNMTTNMMGQDFVAVKVGDLNGNVVANGLVSNEVEGRSAALILQAADAVVEAGEEVSIAVTSAMFKEVLGYQLTLGYDASAMTFAGVESGALEVTSSNVGVFADRGQLTMSWNEVEAQNVDADEVLFTLNFRATAGARLSDAMYVNSSITRAEAYVGGNETGVELRFTGAESEFALYQNVPNPFEGRTVIGFNLPEAGAATMTIYDVTGKVLRVIDGEFAKGYNQIDLMRTDVNASGVVYYQLTSGEYSATKKMIIVE